VKILNLDGMPDDAIERLVWLNGVMKQVVRELEPEWQNAYFEARLTQRLDQAEGLGYHSHKRVMQFTRRENERRGRLVRWGDKRG
jgi:hypothetical protein